MQATVISGADGSVLWTLGSAYMQMSSSLMISTNLVHQDSFLFRVQGRDSKFRWNDGKLHRLDENVSDLSNYVHTRVMTLNGSLLPISSL